MSSKGLGLVELGSEEMARSRDSEDLESRSIWLVQLEGRGMLLELQIRTRSKLETFAPEGSSAGRRLNWHVGCWNVGGENGD